MAARTLPAGVALREYRRRDGSVTASYSVRWKEPDGGKRRRSFDALDDALDFQAKRRSAKRWRPEELRQEQAGRLTLAAFFERWWLDHAIVELKRSTLSVYRTVVRLRRTEGSNPLRLRPEKRSKFTDVWNRRVARASDQDARSRRRFQTTKSNSASSA
jgi:hypothetical protein